MYKTLLIHIHILTSNDSKLHLLSTLQYEFLWAWPDKPQDKFKWRYDRRSGNCNLSNCKCPHPPPPKIQDFNDFNGIRTYGLLPLVRTALKPRNFFAFICNCLNAVTTVTIMYSLKLMYFHSSNHIQTLLKKKKTNKKNQATVWIRASLIVFIAKSRKGKRRNLALWKMHAEIPDKNYREKLSVIVQLAVPKRVFFSITSSVMATLSFHVYFSNISDTAPNAAITFNTTISFFSFHSFPTSFRRIWDFSFFSSSLSFTFPSPGLTMSMILASLACLSRKIMPGLLLSTTLSHCPLRKSRSTLKPSLSTTRSVVC